jgi:chromosome segregation ATPase
MKIKFFLLSLLIVISLPAIALGGSFTSSLIQGKSPAESIDILASQIDAIFGRVEHIENQQSQSDEKISTAQLEIERLKLENENLKLKTNKLDSETTGIRAEKTRHDRCAELAKQISDNEKTVTAPYLERIKPLQNEYNELRKTEVQNMRPETLQVLLEIQGKMKVKQKEIQSIYQEMEDAIKESRETPKMKPIIEEAKELLCA